MCVFMKEGNSTNYNNNMNYEYWIVLLCDTFFLFLQFSIIFGKFSDANEKFPMKRGINHQHVETIPMTLIGRWILNFSFIFDHFTRTIIAMDERTSFQLEMMVPYWFDSRAHTLSIMIKLFVIPKQMTGNRQHHK